MVGVWDSRGNQAETTRESRGKYRYFAAMKGGTHDLLILKI